MSQVRGIRGATTVEEDAPEAIVEATTELLSALVTANQIDPAQVAGVWFTTTPDLRSEFPAVAARRLGWVDVPLLCGQEMAVGDHNPLSVPRCIRTMILVNTERQQHEMRPVYLRGATAIKAELDRTRAPVPPPPSRGGKVASSPEVAAR